MKGILLGLVIVSLTGCAMKLPAGSFMPYTTAEGQHGWVYGARGLTQEQITAGISQGIAQNNLCGAGWKITSVKPSGDDLTLYEGVCK